MNEYDLKSALLARITEPLGTLCTEEELVWVLRRRLTKKEYKVFKAEISGEPDAGTLRATLRIDAKRHEELTRSVTRKLNSDRLKRELFCSE